MKLKWFGASILFIGIAAFLIFKIWETSIIAFLAPLFPAYTRNPPLYYSDMIRLIATELLWMTIFLGLFFITLASTWFHDVIDRFDRRLTENSQTAMVSILAAFTIVTVLVATLGLRDFPNSADEYAYLFQAEDLAAGNLWSDVHPLPQFFDFDHIAQKDGKWIGRFPPGWPVLLAIAFVVGIPPFLINVILGVIALWFFFELTKRLYDERIAIWSLLGVAATGFYIFNSASYFSHTSSFLHVVCAMYFTLRYFDKRQGYFGLLAGVFVGLLALTRPFTAVLIFAPFYLYIVTTYKWQSVKPILLITAGAMPMMLFLLWYNYKTTGDALVPVTVWAYDQEGVGFLRDHTPAKGLKHIFKRFAMFIYWVSPHLLILYGIFITTRLFDFRNILRHPEDYYFLLLVVGYFFYYEYGGNQYGPRFYFEGFPFLVAFVVVKALRQDHWWGRALLVTGMLFAFIKIPFITDREHTIVNERMDIYDKVAEAKIENAVILVRSATSVIRPMYPPNLVRNDKHYNNDVLYALDLGWENRVLMDFYSDKKFYLYKRNKYDSKGELVEYSDSLLVSDGYQSEIMGEE